MPRWTAEENHRLLTMLIENSRDNGNVVHGFYITAAEVFNRNPEGIRRHANYLMQDGIMPNASARANYLPLKLQDTEAAWLAGILDGEGTIPTLRYKHGARKYKAGSLPCNSVRATLVFNTNRGIIDRVLQLVPFAKESTPRRPGLGTKNIWHVDVYGSRNVYVILARLLPFMAETKKIERAQEIITLIEARLESIDPWLMTPLEE